jgi:hypothetical protein
MTATEVFLEQLRDDGGDLVTSRRSPSAEPEPAAPSTKPPSGA